MARGTGRNGVVAPAEYALTGQRRALRHFPCGFNRLRGECVPRNLAALFIAGN